MRTPWLGSVLRDAGLRVETPVGTPHGRGRAMDAIHGVVVHDTVTTRDWSDLAVARLLRDGRPDLPGPLSQLGVRRDGTVDWIADGRCNHNGYGRWGNDAIGIEVYCAGGLEGREEPWNDLQRTTVVTACRAIAAHVGLTGDVVAGHKETDPDRKIDPYMVDMDRLRTDIATIPRRYRMLFYAEGADLVELGKRMAQVDIHAAVTGSTTAARQALDAGEEVTVVGGPAVRKLRPPFAFDSEGQVIPGLLRDPAPPRLLRTAVGRTFEDTMGMFERVVGALDLAG